MSTEPARGNTSAHLGVIAGRYELRAELGRGGMGSVHRAFDRAADSEVALKILELVTPFTTAMFEREFRTLATLQHPSVIQVDDYGITEDGRRYYTMEILPGKDLAEVSPLPWSEACRHLRDVATSLALLHSRGLLHRDVSPRNVRFDVAGRAKLIDFGALCEFGARDEVVGTPACMAPEVVRRQPLDARTDLFSLGAVAYWALTGTPAHNPGSVHAVEFALQTRPQPPSHHRSDVPQSLDRLVMSMLAEDPLERPASAAEVIERLGAISNLEEESQATLARSHIASAGLAGREREQLLLGDQIARAQQGQGSSTLIMGARGSGRSRLLAELEIEGRLRGLATLRVDALAHPGAPKMVRGLASALLKAAPVQARDALGGHLSVLSQVDPELPIRAGLPRPERLDTSSSPVERRARIQGALAGWITDVARQRPLLLLVDDVHALDTTSAGFLVLLAHASLTAPLMLVTTRREDVEPPAAVGQLEKLSVPLELAPLDEVALDALLASTFGEAPHRIRLSGWLFTVGRGNPSHTFILLNELIARQIIRYEGGAWALPSALSEIDLPQSLIGILAEQVAQLEPLARELAQIFALHRGGLTLKACENLLSDGPTTEVARAVGQLTDQGVVARTGDEYRMAEDAVRRLLLENLETERVHVLHRRLGDALREIHQDVVEAVLAGRQEELSTEALLVSLQIGWYLADGNDFQVGHTLLRNAAFAMTNRGDGLPEAVPLLETALQGYRAQGRSRFDTAPMLMPLALAGNYANWRLTQRYGSEAMSVLCEATGLDRAVRWSRWLGRPLALLLAVGVAMLLYRFTSRRRMVPKFKHTFLGMSLGVSCISSYLVLEDRSRAREVFHRLRPLGWFPKASAIRLLHEFQRALVENAEGRYGKSSDRARSVRTLLDTPEGVAGLPETARLQLLVGACLATGQLDALRTDSRIQEAFETLRSVATSVSRQATASVQAAYHAHRGELRKYVVHQKQLDLLAAQAGTTWREDLTGARRVWATFALCEDVMALKRLHRKFDSLVLDLPSLRRVRDGIHAAYLSERGRHAQALTQYGATLEEAVREGNTPAAMYATVYARLLRGTGEAERAWEVCADLLERLPPGDREFEVATMGPRLELGLALVAMGRLDEAHDYALALLERQKHDNPLLLGLAHKLVGQVALARGDRELFGGQLAEMARWFRLTENPALVSQCHRLAGEGRDAGLLAADAASQAVPRRQQVSTLERIQSAFDRCSQPSDRLEIALSILMEESGAEQGYLYQCEASGLRYGAPTAGATPPQGLDLKLSALLAANSQTRVEDSSADTDFDFAFEDDEPDTVFLPSGYETISIEDAPAGRALRALPLSTSNDNGLNYVGVVALWEGYAPLRPLDPYLLQEVAEHLHAANDGRSP